MTRHSVIITAATFFVLMSLAGCRPADAPLVYRYQPGTTYLYADTARSNQTQEMMGQEMKITSVATSVSRMVGESVTPNGAMVMVTSLDTMVVDTKSPMKDTVMVVRQVMGKRARTTVTPGGEVVSRVAIDTIAMGNMMRGMGMRETIKFHRLSGKPAAVDSTWKSEVVDSVEMMGGKLITRTKMEYMVKGKPVVGERSFLDIGYKGEIGMEGKGSMMGMDFFMEGKGKTTGNFLFDPLQGVAVQDNSVVDTDMTAAVTGQQSMTIPITTTVTTTHKLISVEKATK
jgi:hypothetical protein